MYRSLFPGVNAWAGGRNRVAVLSATARQFRLSRYCQDQKLRFLCSSCLSCFLQSPVNGFVAGWAGRKLLALTQRDFAPAATVAGIDPRGFSSVSCLRHRIILLIAFV